MKNSNYIETKIIRYVYLQPETSVSIEKILNKYKWLTRDDLSEVLSKMVDNGFVKLEPNSTVTTQVVNTIHNDGSCSEVSNSPKRPLIYPTHVLLTLDGKIKAEEHKALAMKSVRIMVTQPLVNSIISGLIGFILGYLFTR